MITDTGGDVVSVRDNAFIPDLLFTYIGATPIPEGTLGHFGANSITNFQVRGKLMAKDHTGPLVIDDAVNSDNPFVPTAPLPSTASLGFVLLFGIGGLKSLRVLSKHSA